MARVAFEALGIELTEGKPDTSANKANEKKSRTMKKTLAVAGIGAAVTIGSLNNGHLLATDSAYAGDGPAPG
jgi:butyrate kinase